MFLHYLLSDGPDFTVLSNLYLDHPERSWRRPVKNEAGVNIKPALVTRAFQPVIRL